ncbi:glycosyltransferase family 39 protein [Thalassobaculum salexigens]|uniref:glycosyltransferase family 39 protein n=1 Tax=Thalassobaculum salexigens TaxID=455360 RepID=UPI0003FEFD04|nr:glycosyltransferase family 39 protein [Thalassobaculum salexigens]
MSRLLSFLDRPIAAALALSRVRVFLAAVALYYGAGWLIRMVLLSGSSGDEAQLMLYGQSFALGYDFGNPPVAGWLAAVAEWVVGPTLGATVAIRYGLLALFFAAMLGAARDAIADRRLAVAAALSPVAFWFLGWASLTVYMDSLALIVALATTVWLMLRLSRLPTTAGFLCLLPVIGLGLLSKFSYGPVLVLLILSALAVPRMRAVVADRRFWIAVAGGVILAAPAHGYVLAQMETWLAVAEARILDGAIAAHPPEGPLERGLLALKAAFDFSLPLLPLFVLFFGRALWTLRTQALPVTQRPVVLWLGLWVVLVLFSLGLAMAVAGVDKLREHYLFVLIPLPILLFALVPPGGVGGRVVGGYLAVLCLLAVTALGGLAAQAMVAPLDCSKCRLVMPWSDYAGQLRAAGFERGTIVSFDSPSTDAGPNLRRHLETVRVWTNKRPFYSPPPLAEPGGCVVVWNETRYPATLDSLRAAPVSQIGEPLPAHAVVGTLTADLPLTGRPAPVLGYALIAEGIGGCR